MQLGVTISDILYGGGLFFNACLFLPQAWRVFKKKRADEMSLLMFLGFNLIQLLGFINGVYNHDYALIIGQLVSFVACGLVTAQIVVYRFFKKKSKTGKHT